MIYIPFKSETESDTMRERASTLHKNTREAAAQLSYTKKWVKLGLMITTVKLIKLFYLLRWTHQRMLTQYQGGKS